MSKGNYRTCICCRRQYRYCGSCADYELWEKWHTMFHDQNCHDIWYVLSDFESGVISKEEAKEQLAKLDTSVIKNESALESYKKIIEPDKKPEPVSAPQEETPAPHEPLSVSEELKQHAAVGETKKIKVQPKSRVVATTKKPVVEKG